MARRFARLIARAKMLPAWWVLASSDSYLITSGWFMSRSSGLPVDGQGHPIPWITYASLSFLEPRVRSKMSVFEFGAGASTLWWAKRVRRIVSCEHDFKWLEQVRSRASANVELVYATLDGGQYAKQILGYQNEFDIVVLDGRDRVTCARNTLSALTPGGVVLWDNADRQEYAEGFDYLLDRGFRRIDFVGMGPINTYSWTTSIFYRPGNCLGL